MPLSLAHLWWLTVPLELQPLSLCAFHFSTSTGSLSSVRVSVLQCCCRCHELASHLSWFPHACLYLGCDELLIRLPCVSRGSIWPCIDKWLRLIVLRGFAEESIILAQASFMLNLSLSNTWLLALPLCLSCSLILTRPCCFPGCVSHLCVDVAGSRASKKLLSHRATKCKRWVGEGRFKSYFAFSHNKKIL